MTNTPAVQIPMHPVESSQIHSIGHDPDTATLAVRFKKNGKPDALYHYANVDTELATRLNTAPSVGSFFYREIKPRALEFPYTRIGEPVEAGGCAPPIQVDQA